MKVQLYHKHFDDKTKSFVAERIGFTYSVSCKPCVGEIIHIGEADWEIKNVIHMFPSTDVREFYLVCEVEPYNTKVFKIIDGKATMIKDELVPSLI